MKKFLIILPLLGLLCAPILSFSQKKKKNKTEERLQTDAKNDALSLPGNKTPYKTVFYEALRLKTVGDFSGSVELFEECLKMEPNDDAVLYVLANFYAGGRQLSKAKGYIERAYKIDPDNRWYLELLAYVQQNQGMYEEAEVSYKKLTDLEPYNLDWLYYYSETQLYNGNIKEAIVTYERLIEEAGPIPDLVHRKIELLLDQGQKQQVIEELKELIRLYPDMPEYTGMLLDMYQSNGQRDEAKKLIEELLIKDPKNPHLLLAMADYHNQNGEREQTYVYLNKAFESDLLEIDAKVKLLIEIHDNQTPIDQEAFELMNILKEKHGADAKTYAIEGDFYLKNNERDAAYAAFKKALELDQSKYPIWHETLFLAYYLGKHEELYQQAKKALDFFPTIANVYLYAGVGALYTNRFDEAIEYLTVGKDFVVKDDFLIAEFNFQLGEANMAVKNYAAAQQHFNDALKIDPSNAVYLNNYAYRLAVHNVYLDEALAAIEKADQITPNEGNFLDTYAWVYFQRKDYDKALEKIKRAFELSPKSATVAEHYGDILFKLGEEEKALELWLTSRDLGNTDELLQKKIETKSYHERKP